MITAFPVEDMVKLINNEEEDENYLRQFENVTANKLCGGYWDSEYELIFTFKNRLYRINFKNVGVMPVFTVIPGTNPPLTEAVTVKKIKRNITVQIDDYVPDAS